MFEASHAEKTKSAEPPQWLPTIREGLQPAYASVLNFSANVKYSAEADASGLASVGQPSRRVLPERLCTDCARTVLESGRATHAHPTGGRRTVMNRGPGGTLTTLGGIARSDIRRGPREMHGLRERPNH